ncbi:MAG: metallophosphoesterase [Candidatus Tectomicrobia bacterium]|nr:metallophosphoesterase [Candidatus Tectomicrobia bacterium]
MKDCSHECESDRELTRRISALHLQQRLDIERHHEAQVFGQGRNFFHPENWYSLHALIRTLLRLGRVYARGQRNALDLTVRHHDIPIVGLPAAFHQFTILHLSDLHLDMHPAIAQGLIERLRGVNYHIGVLTGDFRGRTFGPHTAAIEAMAQLRPHLRAPWYGVLGNHDTIRMVPPLEAMGIRMLLNEAVALERGGETIYLAGIDDPHYYKADNVEQARERIPPEAISILLSHSPEIYRRASQAGFHVLLCGHTHGGQICLPGGWAMTYNAQCPRKLCAGAWRYQQMLGYTSVGVGVSLVDVRFNCRPEITLHHLQAA